MAKKPRQISKTGIYHVYARGINHQRIFENEKDDNKFLELVATAKDEFVFDLYAYCLMDNHFHLLIKESEPGDISTIMERLLSNYVAWYNVKYHRSGGLIADRFKSKPVNIDRYFWALIGYIHNNPVEEHMVQKAGYYLYSSYHEYIGKAVLVDVDKAKGILPDADFERWHKPGMAARYKALYERQEANRLLWEITLSCSRGVMPKQIETLEKKERNMILIRMVQAGLSIRKVERMTGISRGVITRVIRNNEACQNGGCPRFGTRIP